LRAQPETPRKKINTLLFVSKKVVFLQPQKLTILINQKK